MGNTIEELMAANKAAAPMPEPEPEPEPAPAPAPAPEPDPEPTPELEPALGGAFKIEEVIGTPAPDEDEPLIKRVKEDQKLKGKLIDVLKEELPGQSSIADPDLYRLDVLKKTDPEAYALHSKNIFSGVAGMELLVKDFIKENPEYAGKEADAEAYIKSEYGLDVEVPEPLDEEDPDNSPKEIKENKAAIEKAKKELAFNQKKFDMAVNKRRESLKASFDAIALPAASAQPTFEERKSKFITGWNDSFTKVVAEENKVKIGLRPTGSESSTPFMEYNVPDKVFAQYAREAVNFAFDGNLDPTPENVEAVRSFIRTRILLDKGDEIFHAIVEKARSMTQEEFDAQIHNPSAINRDRKPSAPGATDEYQKFLSKLKQQ